MEDFFVVDIPVFVPEYDKDKKYGWTNYKDELWDLLKETTHGYCMYCYDRIWINQERRGQIEHGIEKKEFNETFTGLCAKSRNFLRKLQSEIQEARGTEEKTFTGTDM